MSMDDQYHQMQRFQKELERFNEELATSMRDIEEKHDMVSGLWQDEMRKDYDREWKPLKERMDAYLKLEGHRFVDFIKQKIRFLERYLYGR